MEPREAILCVDDEAIILLDLVNSLRQHFGDRFRYAMALSATEGLRKIEELLASGIKVVIVISDYFMPKMNGGEFLTKVSQEYPDIHAIMISGHTNKMVMDEIPTVAFFPKPLDTNELLKHIEKLF